MKKLIILIAVIVSCVATVLTAEAQDQREYSRHEVIELTNGLKVEVLKSRGEGPGRELDVIYYTEKRQTGKRMWQLATVLYQEENAALIARGEKPLNYKPEPEVKKPDTVAAPTVAADMKRTTTDVKQGVANNRQTTAKEKAISKDTVKVEEPVVKKERVVKGPNPANKPVKNIPPVNQAEDKLKVDSVAKEQPVKVVPEVYKATFDSGARHNYVIGLDKNNNPLVAADSIAADTFTKPYDNLVPPEIIEAFKKRITFPPTHQPAEEKQVEKIEKPSAQPAKKKSM